MNTVNDVIYILKYMKPNYVINCIDKILNVSFYYLQDYYKSTLLQDQISTS